MADAAADVTAPQPQRTLSRESCSTESAFADFLSDSSNSSDEDEDDRDSRMLLRMQQQADDRAYSEAPFKLQERDSSFRLKLQRPAGDGAGPRKLMAGTVVAETQPDEATSVDDVMELMTRVQQASYGVHEEETLPARVSCSVRTSSSPSRKTSMRETENAFAAFLSDGSEDDEEDDQDTRMLLRMQQQADDCAYVDVPFKMERPPKASDSSNNSFRLTLAKPGLVEDDDWSGPKKLVEEAMRRASAVDESVDEGDGVETDEFAFEAEVAHTSDEDNRFKDERASFSDANSFTGGTNASFAGGRASDLHESLVSRPPSFDAEGDSFLDEGRPSFSDEHSFTGGDNSPTADNSFVYRPSLLDDDDETQNNGQGQVKETNDSSFVYRPTLPDNDGESTKTLDDAHKASSNSSAAVDDSFVYRPTLPDDVSVQTRRAITNPLTVEEGSFVYRPTLPGTDNDNQGYVKEDNNSTRNNAEITGKDGSKALRSGIDEILRASSEDYGVGDEEDQSSCLSPTAFIRSSDAVALKFYDIDSSFRLHEGGAAAEDDSFSSQLTDSCASLAPPELHAIEDRSIDRDDAEMPVATASVEQNETNVAPTDANSSSGVPASKCFAPASLKLCDSDGRLTRDTDENLDHVHSPMDAAPIADILIKSALSRKSSVASSARSSQDLVSQRRMTASRESWRVSSLDFRESKHAFDEELGPMDGDLQSPRASAGELEPQRGRLSSMFEERNSVTSTSSSFTSFHSQANFFVDDQQSFSSVSSLPLDSRPSGDDSFTNVAILGDDGRDHNERRSSDIISQDVGELRSGSISASYSVVADTLDRSYSDLVDSTVGLDRSFSELVDHGGLYTVNGDRSSATESADGTIMGSSLASSTISQTSATSDKLPFASFSAAKPPPSTRPAQQQQKAENQRSSAKPPVSQDRQKLLNESEQVFYRPIRLPRGSDVKTSKPSNSLSIVPSTKSKKFSSSALLTAIKTREARTDTRSEETEAGDVALGALPPLATPLKITVVARGRGSLSSSFASAKSGAQSSPSIFASSLAMSSLARSSLASSTGTADHLDFTGVYRGSASSLEASHNNGVTAQPQTKFKPDPLAESKAGAMFTLSSVRLERSISDSRMMQRESQRKVEDFFRRTYQKDVDDIDELEVHRWTNRKTRARTTVIECVDDVPEEPHSFAFNNNKVAKIIDLKNLRNGGTQPGWYLEDDAPLTRQLEEDSAKQTAMAMTFGTTSTGTTAMQSMPSDLTPMPPRNYLLSLQAAADQKSTEPEKQKVQVAQVAADPSRRSFFSVSLGPGGDDISQFGAVGRSRADNVSLIPTLPRLSACDAPASSPSPFVTANVFGGSGGVGIDGSPGKSPVAFTGTATGFWWKTGSGFNGPAVNAPFDASRASFSVRPTFADRVQRLSTSLGSTLRRFLHGKDARQEDDSAEVTSPQSQCTAPIALPRTYDHNGFYEAPFKVPGLNKSSQQRRKTKKVENDRAWVRQWLIVATCAVLGLSLGAILVRVVMFNANIFNLSADEVHERQESNGEMALAAGVRWMLLPGHLFLRVWTAVTTPLLVCYLATSLADLVGCADKSALVLSFRSIGYGLLLAVLASIEGVLTMWVTHKAGWFQRSSSSASAQASTLSDDIGVTPLPKGAVGLLCEDSEYLQRLGYGVFACSNASLTLPLYEEVSTNSSGVADSGPAVFALQEVTELLASSTASVPYYPFSLGSGGDMAIDLLSAFTPVNLASQFTEVETDEIASLGGLVIFGLLLGYVCGKRILKLRREAQAAMFESVRSDGPALENPHKARHYIIGVLMELQLALEWLVRPMERYLAPSGFFSLMLGNVVLHHREWRSFTAPMSSLLVGVLILAILHAAVVLPLVLKHFSSRRFPLVTMARAFAPTFLFAFTADNVALSAPVSMQCYARVLTVTRSAAQLATAVTAAFSRNARALYLPLLVLWLLETSSEEELELSESDYFSIGMLSLLSCVCSGSSRLTLAMARTLWSLAASGQSSSATSLLPATMPLLVVCDVLLSRVANAVNVVDHLVLTQLVAQHWVEMVVHEPTDNTSDNIPSPSTLDDSQVPRPPSSALLSSVYL